MRLFIALDIDDAIRDRIARFIEGVSGFAPDARWVKPESLHVTLKFIGEQPEPAVDQIKTCAVRPIAARARPKFTSAATDSSPPPKSARVFWIGMEAGPQLATLAAAIDDKMAALGIPKEDRPFSPHLTLARGAGGFRLAAPQQQRRPQSHLPAPAGKTAGAVHPGVWYHDGPQFLSVPEPTLAERIKIHKASRI